MFIYRNLRNDPFSASNEVTGQPNQAFATMQAVIEAGIGCLLNLYYKDYASINQADETELIPPQSN